MQSTMELVPRSSASLGQIPQFVVADIVHPIFYFSTQVAHQTFLFIQQNSEKLRSEGHENIIRKNFLSRQKVTENPQLNQLILRVNAIVEKK